MFLLLSPGFEMQLKRKERLKKTLCLHETMRLRVTVALISSSFQEMHKYSLILSVSFAMLLCFYNFASHRACVKS